VPARRSIVVRVAALLAVGAFTTASCSGSDDAPPPTSALATTTSTVPPRSDDGVLKVGVLLPATGPGETLGTPMRVAIEAGIALINENGGVLGSAVEFSEADESTTSGMQDLLDDGVDAIIGPASSLVALSQLATAVSSPNGVVVCSPTASALALDDFPDNGYFFRTVPSDSLQMEAIARQAERTGEATATVAYLDDPYGRGLARAVAGDIAERGVLDLVNQVAFSGDLEDLSEKAAAVLADSPGVLILLADADDGGRFLAAIDGIAQDAAIPQIVVNDAIRTARQAISSLSPSVRMQLTGVAPASASIDGGPEGAFAGQAVDCLNLIALAVQQSESDAPREFRSQIAAVTAVGQLCDTFAECNDLLSQDLQIDYNGLSGNIDLSGTTGDRTRATFDRFQFEADGTERPLDPPIFMP
jgi:branched-chain amino acid transport system substrate-binding protein